MLKSKEWIFGLFDMMMMMMMMTLLLLLLLFLVMMMTLLLLLLLLIMTRRRRRRKRRGHVSGYMQVSGGGDGFPVQRYSVCGFSRRVDVDTKGLGLNGAREERLNAELGSCVKVEADVLGSRP